MKKILILGAALVAFAAVTVPAMAADPLPFPSPQVKQVFIATQTVLPDGTMSSYFAPGSTVVFRSYAVDPKTRSIVDAKAVKYFYVSIAGQPNAQVQVRPVGSGCLEGPSLDGDLDRSRHIPAGNCRLQGAAQADEQAAGPVRADAGRRRRC